jgi:hypothetical protein
MSTVNLQVQQNGAQSSCNASERGRAEDILTLTVHSDCADNEHFIVLFYTSPLVSVVQGGFAQ